MKFFCQEYLRSFRRHITFHRTVKRQHYTICSYKIRLRLLFAEYLYTMCNISLFTKNTEHKSHDFIPSSK